MDEWPVDDRDRQVPYEHRIRKRKMKTRDQGPISSYWSVGKDKAEKQIASMTKSLEDGKKFWCLNDYRVIKDRNDVKRIKEIAELDRAMHILLEEHFPPAPWEVDIKRAERM